jgi:hypothetical protein
VKNEGSMTFYCPGTSFANENVDAMSKDGAITAR